MSTRRNTHGLGPGSLARRSTKVNHTRMDPEEIIKTMRQDKPDTRAVEPVAPPMTVEFDRWWAEYRVGLRNESASVRTTAYAAFLAGAAVRTTELREAYEGWRGSKIHARERHGCVGGVPGDDRIAWIEERLAKLTDD